MRLISAAIPRVSIVITFVTVMASTLVGCGGGGGGTSPPAAADPSSSPPPISGTGGQPIENRLSGSVGDGPLVGATVLVFNVSGDMLAELVSDESASYTVSVRDKGSEYPLTVHADGGTDLVTGSAPDFSMSATVSRPARASRVNINPHGTLMVETASRMAGGIAANLDHTMSVILDRLNFGLDPALVPDPMTTEVSDANVAALLKASEAVGEMVRRTRDALAATMSVSGNEVVSAVAADMTDGHLDGRGAPGTAPRIAAVANVVSAQVLTEALQNGLYVNGVLATQRIDDSIRSVRPGTDQSVTSESVTVNAEMLAQTRLMVDAARAVSDSSVLAALRVTLDQIPPGARPSDIRGRLPAGWREELTATIQQAALGSGEDVESVNAVVRSGAQRDAGIDPVPTDVFFSVTSHQVIEGGQTSLPVQRTDGTGPAWVDYEFVSLTATPDEDFAATPGRLWFADGQLSGYIIVNSLQDTIAEEAENFEVHLVAVSDGWFLGADTVSAVTVADDDAPAPALGSATLRWTPPTEREDGSALNNLAGYKVLYGLDQTDLDHVVVLDNPGLTSYVVDNLYPGTWYFALTAFDTEGRESGFSNVGSKMIL